MEVLVRFVSVVLIAGLIGYTIIGTGSRVDAIKIKAPSEIEKRGWKILRHEGFQYGSWDTHGGKVWYHVADTLNPSIQYRVAISMWEGELQYYYGAPEVLERIEIKSTN